MACKIFRNNKDEIVEVRANNGAPSILFDSLVEVTSGNKEDALKLYAQTLTPTFKEWFGDWENNPSEASKVVDKNGEPLLENASYTNKDGLKVSVLNGTGGPVIDTFTSGETVAQPIIEPSPKQEIEKLKNQGPKYTVPSTSVTLQSVVDKIRKTIKLQGVVYEERSGGHKFIERNKNLAALVEHDDSIQTVLEMVAEASHWMSGLKKRMDTIQSIVYHKDGMDQKDIYEALKLLDETKNFAGAYTILDDMVILLEAYPEMAAELGLVEELIAEREKLMSRYLKFSLDAMTAWIYPYVERANKNLREQGRPDLQLSKENIRDRFLTAPKDIGFLNGMLGATINSSDEINSLIAMAIKAEMEKARLKDIHIQNDLLEEYLKQDGPKNNPKAFNKDFIRMITLPDGSKNWAFIEEIDEDRFEVAKAAMRKAIGDKPDESDRKTVKEWHSKRSAWFKANTELRPDYKEFMEQKRQELGDDFESYMNLNTFSTREFHADQSRVYGPDKTDLENVRVLTGEFIRPKKSIYGNDRFEKIMQNSYYKKLYTTYKEANDKLPVKQRLRYGMIPQVVKSAIDGVIDNGLDATGHISRAIEAVKNINPNVKYEKNKDGSFKLDEAGKKIPVAGQNEYLDTQYGRKGLQTLAGENLNYLPIYYNKVIENASEVSQDVVTSVLMFSQMANNFESMASIMPHVNTATALIIGSPAVKGSGRKVIKTSAIGQIINAVTGDFINKDSSIRVNDRLKAFIDAVYWGHSRTPLELHLFGKTINVDKYIDSLGFVNALSTMTLNITGAINNSLIANYNTMNEATAGRYYNTKDWLWGKGEYARLLADGTFIGDFTKITGKSKISQLVDLYDVIQGEFKDKYGRKISGNAVKRNFSMSAMFVLNNATEHEAQVSAFIGFMHATKIKDNSGKEISLYDAYEISNNRLTLKPGVSFSEDQRFDIMNKIHGLSKELNGNYNSFDASKIQTSALGRLALMFRKHIYTGYKRRWGAEMVDYEQGRVSKGYYRQFLKVLITDIKAGRVDTLINWKRLSADERRAFKQSMFDAAFFTMVLVMYGIIDDDDLKDNSFLQNVAILQLRRLEADMKFYWLLNADTIRLMRTPAVSMDYTMKIIDWLDQAVFEWDEEKMYYQRKTGIHAKGDSKAWAKFSKLAPGLRGWYTFTNPIEQLTVFRDK